MVWVIPTVRCRSCLLLSTMACKALLYTAIIRRAYLISTAPSAVGTRFRFSRLKIRIPNSWLQQPDVMAHCRLRQVQLLRRLCIASRLHHCQKRPHLSIDHGFTRPFKKFMDPQRNMI